ncbi:hypothetical protein FISHEDRAFT_75491 [Fistulina hepatica ATCC 64428]|uniref:REJ domain-containing protein n=1 Tax=Fistulina hepatica ATCC 64428 TaxID=1128425 RepID=A0A0D7A9F2_9AGAR|nr:hypothetical protein FISHEDRAFT_75491 [Fistulina hepatica ATCC 64428]
MPHIPRQSNSGGDGGDTGQSLTSSLDSTTSSSETTATTETTSDPSQHQSTSDTSLTTSTSTSTSATSSTISEDSTTSTETSSTSITSQTSTQSTTQPSTSSSASSTISTTSTTSTPASLTPSSTSTSSSPTSTSSITSTSQTLPSTSTTTQPSTDSSASTSLSTTTPLSTLSQTDTSSFQTTSYSTVVTTSDGVPTTFVTPIPTNLASSGQGGSNSGSARTAIIAGSTAGAVVFVLIVLAALFVYKRHQKRELGFIDALIQRQREGRGAGGVGLLDDEFDDEDPVMRMSQYRDTPSGRNTPGGSIGGYQGSVTPMRTSMYNAPPMMAPAPPSLTSSVSLPQPSPASYQSQANPAFYQPRPNSSSYQMQQSTTTDQPPLSTAPQADEPRRSMSPTPSARQMSFNPAMLRTRIASDTGSIFHEEVWPPPGGLELVDPLDSGGALDIPADLLSMTDQQPPSTPPAMESPRSSSDTARAPGSPRASPLPRPVRQSLDNTQPSSPLGKISFSAPEQEATPPPASSLQLPPAEPSDDTALPDERARKYHSPTPSLYADPFRDSPASQSLYYPIPSSGKRKNKLKGKNKDKISDKGISSKDCKLLTSTMATTSYLPDPLPTTVPRSPRVSMSTARSQDTWPRYSQDLSGHSHNASFDSGIVNMSPLPAAANAQQQLQTPTKRMSVIAGQPVSPLSPGDDSVDTIGLAM